jgi:hypothetical protein
VDAVELQARRGGGRVISWFVRMAEKDPIQP